MKRACSAAAAMAHVPDVRVDEYEEQLQRKVAIVKELFHDFDRLPEIEVRRGSRCAQAHGASCRRLTARGRCCQWETAGTPAPRTLYQSGTFSEYLFRSVCSDALRACLCTRILELGWSRKHS